MRGWNPTTSGVATAKATLGQSSLIFLQHPWAASGHWGQGSRGYCSSPSPFIAHYYTNTATCTHRRPQGTVEVPGPGDPEVNKASGAQLTPWTLEASIHRTQQMGAVIIHSVTQQTPSTSSGPGSGLGTVISTD